MITISELINKIKWDKREKPEEYVFYYVDRITKKLVPIKYKKIKRIDQGFMIINRDDKETEIPLHRIREVRKDKVSIWKR
ncbi:MAG: DUF504 domain-containing protein [Nanoarchaeota archaeon]|nr:DUF504 domain-containing protein [Nanoarchaeota archaeon]